MWLMGYPKAVSVSASSFNLLGARIAQEQGAQFDCEDLVTALVRLDNGASLNLEVSWAGGTDRGEDMMTGLYGTAGAVIQRNVGHGYDFECLALDDVAGQMVRVEPQTLPCQAPSAIDDFIDCVADDREPTASAEHGLEMMRIIDAIYRSAEQQREVRLAPEPCGQGGRPPCPASKDGMITYRTGFTVEHISLPQLVRVRRG